MCVWGGACVCAGVGGGGVDRRSTVLGHKP